MKFLLDENVEYRLVSFLQNLGHNVTAIGYNYPHSLPDSGVLELAQKEQRILLTNDHSDFGELIFRQHHPHSGIIIFRLKIGDIETKQKRLQKVITEYTSQLDQFIVITSRRVRIRKTIEKLAA